VIAGAARVLLLASLGASTAQPPARTTNDAVFTAAQAERGQTLYQPQCAACHGQTLAGAEAAPALAGPAFMGSWNEAPLGDLFERIRISMPQDKPGSLSRQQTAEIVAFILSVNKAPAGQVDLPGDLEVLKAIKIVPAK
jgi:mono/diheme cytochrome c family protein